MPVPNSPVSLLYRDASRAALLGLVVNFALGLAKLGGGLVGNSFALLSDAVNSFGDVFTSASSFLLSGSPSDLPCIKNSARTFGGVLARP